MRGYFLDGYSTTRCEVVYIPLNYKCYAYFLIGSWRVHNKVPAVSYSVFMGLEVNSCTMKLADYLSSTPRSYKVSKPDLFLLLANIFIKRGGA